MCQNWQKLCNFTLLLAKKTQGLRRKQFSVCSKHIVCSHCYYAYSKCSPLAEHTLSDGDSIAALHDGTAPTGTHGVTPSQSWILCILHRQCQLNASWYFVTLARKTHEILVFNRISFYFTHFDTSSKQHSDLFFLYTSSVLSRSCVREFRSTRETRNVSLT